MKTLAPILGLAALLNFNRTASAAEVSYSKDGRGVPGYHDTPVQPWSGWHTHDPDRPVPERIAPGEPGTQQQAGTAPSDAIVLFDGHDTSRWLPTAEWKIADGLLVAGKGFLTTTQAFGDCQLHLEWQAPNPPVGGLWDQGNNGLFMMGMTEIQIFDSWTNKLYADGQAGAVYAQTPPLVDPIRRSGEWQTYDLIWWSPTFADGKLEQPARLTMLFNGVLVHLDQEIYGTTPHRGLAKYPNTNTTGPLSLMGHSNPVRFRNIWIRPLPPRKDLKPDGKEKS